MTNNNNSFFLNIIITFSIHQVFCTFFISYYYQINNQIYVSFYYEYYHTLRKNESLTVISYYRLFLSRLRSISGGGVSISGFFIPIPFQGAGRFKPALFICQKYAWPRFTQRRPHLIESNRPSVISI